MKKKIVSVLLCMGLIASMLVGCGQEATKPTEEKKEDVSKESEAPVGEEITLSIYAQYADEDTKVPYDYAVQELAIAYPNVKLNLIVQAQDDGATLKTLAATGQLPDIFQAGTEIINSFRETSQVMVLNDVAKSTGFMDKLFEGCKELAYADDGNIYAFPYAGQEYVLWYYNKAIFAECGLEVPKTFEELKNCIEVINDKGYTPMALFGQEGWITTALFDAIATRYNPGGIKDLDMNNANISDAEYLDAVNVLYDLVQKELLKKDAASTNYDQASEMFLSGQAAMFLNGQWYIEDATTALGEDVDWMFYPSYDEASYEEGKAVFSGGGSTSGYAVNPDGAHAELAAEVAEFLAEKYCEAKVMYRHNPLVSLNTGAVSEDVLPAMMQKLSDTIPSVTHMTKFTWGLSNSIFNDGIQTETQGIISGQYSTDEFIENMTQIMESMHN